MYRICSPIDHSAPHRESMHVKSPFVGKLMNYIGVITQLWTTLWIKKDLPNMGKVSGLLAPSFYHLRERLNLIVGVAVFCHFLADLALRVNDRGVVLTAELLANLGK